MPKLHTDRAPEPYNIRPVKSVDLLDTAVISFPTGK